MDLKIEKTSFFNNPFIGMFAKTNNSITLLPKHAPEKLSHQAANALGTKAVRLFVDQSALLGIFTALNDTGCIIQDFAETHDKFSLKKEGLNVYALRNFSPGNNILCNNKACLINPEIPLPEAKKIGDCLGVEMFRQKASTKSIGTANVVTDRGLLAYNETSDIELKYLEKIFQARGIVGTTNLGQTYNGFSVVANNRGALIGSLTTGIEVQRVYEALGN